MEVEFVFSSIDGFSQNYLTKRFGEAYHITNKYGLSNIPYARDLGQTKEEIEKALSHNKPTIIAFNAHGDDDGCFVDEFAVNPTLVTPDFLWYGFQGKNVKWKSGRSILFTPTKPDDRKVYWPGLNSLLKDKSQPIHVVLAECQGARFAYELRELAKKENAAPNIIIYGLSFGATYSATADDETVLDALYDAQHLELTTLVDDIIQRERLALKQQRSLEQELQDLEGKKEAGDQGGPTEEKK